MKKTFSIILLTIAGSYLSCKNLEKYSGKMRFENSSPGFYKVYKIDSIDNYYLIYAKKGDSLFKIVSEKVPFIKCRTIKVNSEYKFELQSRLAGRDSSGIRMLPEASSLVNGFYYGDSTIIELEGDSIKDLYSSREIKGLCFAKKNE